MSVEKRKDLMSKSVEKGQALSSPRARNSERKACRSKSMPATFPAVLMLFFEVHITFEGGINSLIFPKSCFIVKGLTR